eukprot:TRINITY_DN6065_c0_g1_i2.p1 TRINITY_DN6065_c0_g1~~TRINITY_DN6065_c0_g1_i2.p1  ORF type:complete len:219 (+),score=69.76 TRINITY_DN6065_c0_g1_i2:96-752(+)
MVQGTVMSWKKQYGFAVAGDMTVFIHSANIGGSNYRLIIGETLNFTPKTVPGHDGRVAAENVSGPAIITWEDWKAQYGRDSGAPVEDYLASKKRWEEHKAAQNWQGRPAGGGRPAGRRPAAGAGRPEETRVDKADGNRYTKADFVAQYGGLAEWIAAAPKPVVPRGGRGAGAPAGKRQDVDGRYYTKAEFKKEYGGYAQWDAAPRKVVGRGRGRGRAF